MLEVVITGGQTEAAWSASYPVLIASTGSGLQEAAVTLPRFRIGVLMGLVAIAALDFGAIRAAIILGDGFGILADGVLPMATILAVCIMFRRDCGIGSSFLLGFGLFGAISIASYFTVWYGSRKLLWFCFHHALQPIILAMRPVPGGEITGLELIIHHTIAAITLFLLPQLAFALLGGFLFRRFRRRRAADR